MKPSGRLLRSGAVLAGILILAGAAGPAAAGVGDAPRLVVERVVALGSEILVTVANLAPEAHSGKLRIVVPLGASVIELEAGLTLPEGQKAFLAFRLPEPPAAEVPLGAVLDDGIPF